MTRPVFDAETLIGEYFTIGAASKIKVNISKDGDAVKSQLLGEVTKSDGQQAPLGSLRPLISTMLPVRDFGHRSRRVTA